MVSVMGIDHKNGGDERKRKLDAVTADPSPTVKKMKAADADQDIILIDD